MSDLGTRLLGETAALIEIPSVSRNEQRIAGVVEQRLSGIEGLATRRVADNVIATTDGSSGRRILFAGHLDTVPAAGNERAVREGPALYGLGAADMKGGLAVMLALAERAPGRATASTFVFYAREEISRSESGLLEIAEAAPELLAADAAIVLEPTGAVIEAGCQGSIRARVVLGGIRAHSARPWTGLNAIHRLGPLLETVSAVPDRRPVIDGCEFRESLQAVGVAGGGVGNVVPGEAEVTINFRYAPDRSPEQGVAYLDELVAPFIGSQPSDRIEIVDHAPAAAPNLEHPVLSGLLEASGAPARAKLGWTDVATLNARGIPAANFGPGDPLVAHHAREYVTGEDLEAVYSALDRLLD